MSEGDEVGDAIADALDLVLIRTYDDAVKHVRYRMPGETETVICNVAQRVFERARAFMARHIP